MKDDRTKMQEDIVAKYLIANKLKCSLILATGFGKSKVALSIIRKLAPSHILIIVNSEDLRDYSWKKEFRKWGAGSLLENFVTIITYQFLNRNPRLPFGVDKNSLVIFDECDWVANTPTADKIMPVFEGIRTLGLTGFITEEKRPWFKENIPILYTYTAAEAQKSGILNKLAFVFVKYNLSLEKDFEVKYKDKGHDKTFLQSENAAYEYQQTKMADCAMRKEIASKEFRDGNLSRKEYTRTIRDMDNKIRFIATARGNILLHSKTTATMARKLIKYIRESSPDSKTMVFSKRTAQSESICGADNVYNGSMTKAKAKATFDAFNKGEIDLIGTCDKVNRGANVDNLDIAIFETFYGGDTHAMQRFGQFGL